MDAEIRPEPTGEEREAILAAVADALTGEAEPRGPWWRLGVRESLAGRPAAPGTPRPES